MLIAVPDKPALDVNLTVSPAFNSIRLNIGSSTSSSFKFSPYSVGTVIVLSSVYVLTYTEPELGMSGIVVDWNTS